MDETIEDQDARTFLSYLLKHSEYRELTFHQLCSLPPWKFRICYKYEHALRMKYNDVQFSRLAVN